MPDFNLLDAPWIPCIRRFGEVPRLYSLPDVLAQASTLVAIEDPSPLITVSVYRLLLAVLHRSLDGPQSAEDWATMWERGQWDLERISGYLHAWHDRFDLFSAEYPFYQTPGIDPAYAKPVTLLAHERASDRSRALLFDHSSEETVLSAAEAARYLVAQHNFSIRGFVNTMRGESADVKSADGAPLLTGAIVLLHGDTLFATLMRNFVQYSRARNSPFQFGGDDAPAWERTGGAQPVTRMPDGYVDLLTWQSRRILLVPQVAEGGQVVVNRACVMKGFGFPDDFDQSQAETMLAFRMRTPGPAGWNVVRGSAATGPRDVDGESRPCHGYSRTTATATKSALA